MRILKYSSFIFLISFLLSSCAKQLDQIPSTSKVLDGFFSNQSEAEEYINSVYGALQRGGLYGQNVPFLGEMPSDNTWDQVPANDNGFPGQLDLFTTISTNDNLSQNWKDSYVAIQRANVVLNRIDSITYTTDALKESRKGAMKFIRALVYFNLVRTYGDVPLVTIETKDPNSYFGQGRTAADAVYNQIIKDLTEAIAELPATSDKTGGVVKTAAEALLGKVYLTLKKYQNAVDVLNDVVQSNMHHLLPNINDVFDINNENNAEDIFSVQFASNVNGNSEGSSFQQQTSPSGSINGAKGHDLPTTYLYNLYTSADRRKGVYIDVTPGGVAYCKKYVANPANPSDGGSNFVVLRYADVLLMLAEANNELNHPTDALTYLNQIRNRAGLDDFTATDKAIISTEVALQRQLELVLEGHRWFDLLRTGNAVQVMNNWFASQGQNITIDTHNLLMPVPQDQIDTDPSIKQNPGYN